MKKILQKSFFVYSTIIYNSYRSIIVLILLSVKYICSSQFYLVIHKITKFQILQYSSLCLLLLFRANIYFSIAHSCQQSINFYNANDLLLE